MSVDITNDDVTRKRWAVYVQHHVVPIGDLLVHEHSHRCVCKPREEEQDSGVTLYVHNAFDQREDN